METNASLGDWLRRRRKALDLTQDALAGQVGCSVGLIRKLESDERRPSRQMAELLVNALQIAPNERQKFIDVARAQLRTERLETLAPVPPPTLPETAPTAPQAPLTARSPLPIPPTPLIGRDNEVREINHLLTNPECRLLTIVGPGGMGKTRLALAVAASQQAAFGNGVYFVALASLSAAEFIVPAIAQALGLTFSGTLEPKTQLLNYLHQKQLLLVLDNLEHLMEGVELLGELLANAADLTLLATSRERLNLQGEWVFDLQGLPVPPSGLTPLSTSPAKVNDRGRTILESYSAVALFVRSAQRVQASFALSEQNSADVAYICRLVDGMPLGIELAAAWIHLLSCQEIVLEIGRSIDFLAVNRRDVPERHRSLRAVFDHSWRLLSEKEQQVLRQLTVFRGGFTRSAAEKVTGISLPLLATLSGKSLVQRITPERYSIHELIRQYALLDWQSSAEQYDDCQARHYTFYLTQTEETNRKREERSGGEWLERLEQEIDNLRAALVWCQATGRIEQGLCLTNAMWRLMLSRGYVREEQEWLAIFLARTRQAESGQVQPITHGIALRSAAILAQMDGDYSTARAMCEYSLELCRKHREKEQIRFTITCLGDIVLNQGDYTFAANLATENLALCRELGDESAAGVCIAELGYISLQQQDIEQALALCQKGLLLTRTYGKMVAINAALAGLAEVVWYTGDYSHCRELYQECMLYCHTMRDKRWIAFVLARLGRVAFCQSDYKQAADYFAESLQLQIELGSKLEILHVLIGIAGVIGLATDEVAKRKQAVRLYAAVINHLSAIAVRLDINTSMFYDRALPILQATFNQETFSVTWSEGYSMTLENSIALALECIA